MSDSEESTATPVQVAAPQNPSEGLATQPAHHQTSEPKDLRMQAFTADTDPDETGCRWNKLNGRTSFSFVSGISKFQISTITSMHFTFMATNEFVN